MRTVAHNLHSGSATLPTPGAVLELLKPVTWFPPMWAFACGVVSSGVALDARPWALVVGIVLVGPLVCASSQVTNDWFDRHVDALNEPHRPIPSGRIPGRWGLYLALFWTGLSLLAGSLLGVWGFGATVLALLLAWAYSAPPVRLKRNGWVGNAAVGFTYEGLAWVTGAAVMLGGLAPPTEVLLLAVLYSLGAHGIMTLNDFKSIEGDRRMGVGSLPARLGAERAARVACVVMILPQLVVASLLFHWGSPVHAGAVCLLVALQLGMMRRLVAAPIERALWYSALGVPVYVTGMMISAFAIRGGIGT
jgi:chlorophyll/bacteriochlorophyll a synthase